MYHIITIMIMTINLLLLSPLKASIYTASLEFNQTALFYIGSIYGLTILKTHFHIFFQVKIVENTVLIKPALA